VCARFAVVGVDTHIEERARRELAQMRAAPQALGSAAEETAHPESAENAAFAVVLAD